MRSNLVLKGNDIALTSYRCLWYLPNESKGISSLIVLPQ